MSQMWISFSVAIESSTHTDNKRKAGDETRSLQGLAANVTPVNIPTESGRHMNLFRHQALCKNDQLGTIKKDTKMSSVRARCSCCHRCCCRRGLRPSVTFKDAVNLPAETARRPVAYSFGDSRDALPIECRCSMTV